MVEREDVRRTRRWRVWAWLTVSGVVLFALWIVSQFIQMSRMDDCYYANGDWNSETGACEGEQCVIEDDQSFVLVPLGPDYPGRVVTPSVH